MRIKYRSLQFIIVAWGCQSYRMKSDAVTSLIQLTAVTSTRPSRLVKIITHYTINKK